MKAGLFRKSLTWVLIVAASLLVLDSWFKRPSERLIREDGAQNLAMAYNLRHHGVMSLDTKRAPESLRPSRYREPLPVLVLSGYMLVLDPVLGDASFEGLLKGSKAKLLKYSDALWGALLIWVMILSARKLGLPAWASALAILLAYAHLDSHHDKLYTEIPGAALIALCSYLSLLALQERRLSQFLAAGLSFGLLMLTKASFLYVAIALLPIYLVYALIKGPKGFALASAALAIAGTLLIIAPWMLRNQMQFGSPDLADRGGGVLMERAAKNRMTREEYVASFYVYAPELLKWPASALTGFGPQDRLPGGRAERLDRGANNDSDLKALLEGRQADIVSYHYAVIGMHRAKRLAFEAAGHPDPIGAADTELQKEALAMIKARPFEHAFMSLNFMWRGAPFMFPFFLFMLVYAWRKRDAPLAAYVLPSLGLIGFYAVLSHFIPRYADPNAPIVAICAALLLHRWLEEKKSRGASL